MFSTSCPPRRPRQTRQERGEVPRGQGVRVAGEILGTGVRFGSVIGQGQSVILIVVAGAPPAWAADDLTIWGLPGRSFAECRQGSHAERRLETGTNRYSRPYIGQVNLPIAAIHFFGCRTRIFPNDCSPTTSSSAMPESSNTAVHSLNVRSRPREPMNICMSNDAPATSAPTSGRTISKRAIRAPV